MTRTHLINGERRAAFTPLLLPNRQIPPKSIAPPAMLKRASGLVITHIFFGLA